MVKKIYHNYYGNGNFEFARPSGWKPKGVVLHNTAGTWNGGAGDKATDYDRGNLSTFAHYYCDKDAIVQVCDTRYGAWHTGTRDGNLNWVGYEICEPKSDADFLENEKAACRQVAEDLKFWGLPANRNTVTIHQLVPGASTLCPWRSVKLHGGARATQDYFIKLINQYMKGDTPKPQKPQPDEYYHSKRVKKLRPKVDCDLHETQSLSKSKVVGKAKKDKEYKVVDIWKKGDKPTDMSRYKIEFEKGKYGWISGNMKYIDSVYYLDCKYAGKTKIQALKNTGACSDVALQKEVEKIKKGDVFTVVDNVTDKSGYPRLKLKSGKYVTARKDYWKFV